MDWHWLGQTALVAYLIVLGVLCVYGLHRYFLLMIYFLVRRKAPQQASRFDELPRVTVQLPMYNEVLVARRVIEAAGRLEYPRDRLEIQVLDDSTDQTQVIARQAVERLRKEGINAVYLHRTDRTGYKAGALEAGLRQATGEFIAIFDADFVPTPSMLLNTIHYFTDPRVGMVQCRWDHLNRGDSLLTETEAVLLDGHFLIEHTARNRSGRFMSFNGTAGIWRRAAIVDAGGWQHDTLTEDLDLSYRAQLRDWRFVFLPELTVPAELPPEMNAFKAQQHRWTKGGAQTCRKLLPRLLGHRLDWRVKLEGFFHLTSFCVYILMLLLSLLVGPAILYRMATTQEYGLLSWSLDFLFFIVGTGSALSFYIVSQWQVTRCWWKALRSVPGLMAIGIGIAFNNALAAIEGLLRPSGEFVRTPKFGDQPEARTRSPHSESSARNARPRSSTVWKAWAELAMGLYLFACFAAVFFFEDWVERASAALPFLGLFIFGYLYVALQTLRGRAA